MDTNFHLCLAEGAWSHTKSTEDTEFSTDLRVSSRIFWTTNGHEFTLMPCGGGMVSHRRHGIHRHCGALWFHADGADFRRSMRSKFCVFLCFLCANISHAKAQSFAKRLREVVSHGTESRCPNLWGESNPRKTQNFPRICSYLQVSFEPLMGTNLH